MLSACVQAMELERGCDLLVGTPGRINMFIERGKVGICGFPRSHMPPHASISLHAVGAPRIGFIFALPPGFLNIPGESGFYCIPSVK